MLTRLNDQRGNWSLIGILVAVAVGLALLAFVLLPKINAPGQDAVDEGLIDPKPGQGVLGASLDKGQEAACQSNLQQCRAAIQMYKIDNDQNPASLDELGLGSVMNCPISDRPYQYEPGSGAVSCATPGHERL